MRRILLVFGTRPEAIKMAPVYRALCERRDRFDPLCCVTGQHREMLDQVLALFEMRPDFDLDLMRPCQELAALHAAIVAGVAGVIDQAKPDLVLVHGDTATAMAGALAAFYAQVPVGHVEAGLRSNDLKAPFPEELNRRTVDTIARYRFAPTDAARINLLSEGCDPDSICVTGNTAIDALRIVGSRAGGEAGGALDDALGSDHRRSRFVVVTCHRRETVAAGLDELCAALGDLADAFPGIRFLFPVHPNPLLRAAMEPFTRGRPNLRLIDPLPYDVFVAAMRASHFILTDSGGMQEEGLALGKPVLVMRGVTERPEAVAAGGARLVGTSRGAIVAEATRLLKDDGMHRAMSAAPNPFGDGHAADRIADFLAAIA